jgi:long-chain fatty acid transport protein
MSGDSVDYGYNLAVAYNPTDALEFAATYRSQVNLNLDGTALLAYPGSPTIPALAAGSYDGGVTLPLPGALNLAAAYTFPSKTTVEFVYEKTYWSAYKSLDFSYANPLAEAIFGRPKAKEWHDTNTFRLGVTQEFDDLTLMAGYVIDETPVPDGTVGFELPDTDSQAFSLGGRYKINENLDVALSGLYSIHEDRTVNNAALSGEFTEGNVLIISAGLGYKF